jgi:hypothetical protein
MATDTIDVAGLEGGSISLASEQLDDLASRIQGRCCAPATKGGTRPC